MRSARIAELPAHDLSNRIDPHDQPVNKFAKREFDADSISRERAVKVGRRGSGQHA